MSAKAATLRTRSVRIADGFLLICVMIVVWQILYEMVGSSGLSPPIQTTENAYKMLASADFWPNVQSTFTALGIALAIEIFSGLVFGLLLGLNRFAGEVIEPILVAFYSVPKIVFYPIILMFCGLGLASEVTFGVMHGILPIMLFTMNAVRSIRRVLIKTAHAFRLSRSQMMWKIAFPAALPEIFTGLRIGFSVTLLGVLFSEMFGSKNGLGFLLMNAIGLNIVDRIMALTLLLASFAAIVNIILLAVDHRLHKRI